MYCSVRCYMSFSAKLLMDRVLLLVLMPALITANDQNATGSTNNCNCTLYATNSPCTIPEPRIVTLPPVMGRMKVNWEKNKLCQGAIVFSINLTQSEMVLCKNEFINHILGEALCEEGKCGGFLEFKNPRTKYQGFMIHENLTTTSNTSCTKTILICKEKENKELVAYKVITGLLLTLITLVLLCRFAQPAYIAIHKRFSQKRQNRWVGPTQTQSVSYHRGQASHPNNNTTKRHSYPGLERLTVYPSREPSSNRNSDYDSYGV
ncbi:hypothetical protein QTP70_019180 [Hemibagrus guttatus]|uniref:T-cell surface glycoprotein CD5 n=1 Tax=Hemibagrus guttatus TaxID=175788 RepID=A0AAE0RHA1_9TELE|nr:hypothetical protein QTP70_019180 [Hemibagrus guttatus]